MRLHKFKRCVHYIIANGFNELYISTASLDFLFIIYFSQFYGLKNNCINIIIISIYNIYFNVYDVYIILYTHKRNGNLIDSIKSWLGWSVFNLIYLQMEFYIKMIYLYIIQDISVCILDTQCDKIMGIISLMQKSILNRWFC